MSFEEAIKENYDPATDSVVLYDTTDPAACEKVYVPKSIIKKLYEKTNELSLVPGECAALCQHAIAGVYGDRKKSVSNWRWSAEKKIEHRTGKTLESVDRLILLTMTHLRATQSVFLSATIVVRGGFDSQTKQCYDALINLRQILSLNNDMQKKVYSSEAKIAASETMRLLTTLTVEHKALMRDSVLYDIRQLKKFHKELKP
jgi:hypothetical protein